MFRWDGKLANKVWEGFVVIWDSITYIGALAFSDCSGLTSVQLLDKVSFVSNGAFANCTGLSRVFIPAGVSEISTAALEGCTGPIRSVSKEKRSRYLPAPFLSVPGRLFPALPRQRPPTPRAPSSAWQSSRCGQPARWSIPPVPQSARGSGHCCSTG